MSGGSTTCRPAPGTTASSAGAAGASRSRRGWPPSSAASSPEPGVDLGPGRFRGAAARHDADVSAGNPQDLLVRAPHAGEQGLRLAGRGDVVVEGDDVEEVGAQVGEI